MRLMTAAFNASQTFTPSDTRVAKVHLSNKASTKDNTLISTCNLATVPQEHSCSVEGRKADNGITSVPANKADWTSEPDTA